MAGLPALQRGESGQVRKEAATATYCKCRGSGSPPYSGLAHLRQALRRAHTVMPDHPTGVIECGGYLMIPMPIANARPMVASR